MTPRPGCLSPPRSPTAATWCAARRLPVGHEQAAQAWAPTGGPQFLVTADSRQVGATALRNLGQDAWLPLPFVQQYSHFSLVEANHHQQDNFSRKRAFS